MGKLFGLLRYTGETTVHEVLDHGEIIDRPDIWLANPALIDQINRVLRRRKKLQKEQARRRRKRRGR